MFIIGVLMMCYIIENSKILKPTLLLAIEILYFYQRFNLSLKLNETFLRAFHCQVL